MPTYIFLRLFVLPSARLCSSPYLLTQLVKVSILSFDACLPYSPSLAKPNKGHPVDSCFLSVPRRTTCQLSPAAAFEASLSNQKERKIGVHSSKHHIFFLLSHRLKCSAVKTRPGTYRFREDRSMDPCFGLGVRGRGLNFHAPPRER